MFLRLIYLKNSTFPSVKTTVDTLIDVRNETSKHHFLRTFARNFSNIDFFLKILPLKDDELAMSEM